MIGHARLFRELLEVRSCEAMPRSTERKKWKGGKTAGTDNCCSYASSVSFSHVWDVLSPVVLQYVPAAGYHYRILPRYTAIISQYVGN